MIFLNIKKEVWFLCAIVVFCFSISFNLYAKNEPMACNLESIIFLENTSLSSLEKKEVKIFDGSTEGGKAVIYWDKKTIISIKSVYLGETGKTDIDYFFNPAHDKQYLVSLTDYHYTVPIGYPNSKIASSVTSKFAVCEQSKPNYPNSVDMDNTYNRAVSALSDIRSNLK